MPKKRAVKAPARVARPLSAVSLNDVFGWALIFCATLVAYLPAISGALIWDDTGHVTRPDLQSLYGLWRIWFDIGATQQYYPLLHSAFWFEHLIWGDAVQGYHLTNIVLHATSACLVVLIVKRLRLPGAWLAGFIFALHPVNVEGVAWISEQKDTLSGVFALAAVLTWLQFDQTREKSKYLLATGLFVLALLSKTVTATLPAVLLVIVWWKRARISWKQDVQPLLPWFALGASAGLFTAWAERTLIGATGAAYMLSPVQRVLLAGRAIWFYAAKLIWPANLTFSYPHWKIDPAVWWQALFPIVTVALGAGLWFVARRSRGPLASFLIFTGTLFPVLGFLNVYPFRYAWVADHFEYLASLGIIVPAASLLVSLAGRISSDKRLPIGFSAALLLVLGVLTWRQTGEYHDMETLWRETLRRNPQSYLAHNNLGGVLQNKGRLQEAMAEFDAARRIEPDYPEAHYNRGIALLKISPGNLQDAIAEYRAAIKAKPDYAEAHNNLGSALLKIPGHLEEAIAEFQTAIRIKPDFAEAHNNLGSALERIPGRGPDAMAEHQAALRFAPDDAEAHYNLGTMLAQTPGRLPDAIAEYQAALRLKPDYAEAHSNLGSALAHTPGRMQEAVAEYQAALRLKPDYAQAHNNLGSALAHTPGHLQDGIAEYQAALRLDPNLVEAHNNLGNALAQLPGRLPDAIAEYRAALRIKPDLPDLHYNLGLALAQTPGGLQDAIAEYHTALRLKPNYADAHFGLGNALAHVPGRRQDAIAEFQAVLLIEPDFKAAKQSIELLRAAR